MSNSAQHLAPQPRSAPRRWSKAWLIAAALGVIAAAAVLITAPAVFSTRRADGSAASDTPPLAPGLAALSDQELLDLLPVHDDFPASWTVKDSRRDYQWNTFGYLKYHEYFSGLRYGPDECVGITVTGLAGAFDSAGVSGRAPSAEASSYDRKDIDLNLGREFDPAGFDDMMRRISHCVNTADGTRMVHILEDARPKRGPQRFRYTVTTISGSTARTDYYSYARAASLVLSGSATDGHQQVFDTFFDATLGRIGQR